MKEPRIKKLRAALSAESAALFVLPNREGSGQPATRYLSGFSGSDSLLVVSRAKTYLLTDGRYLESARKEAAGCEIIDGSERPLSRLLAKLLPRAGRTKILLDGSVTAFSFVGHLTEKNPRPSIVNKDGFLRGLRREKDDEEIALLRMAADVSVRAFRKFLPFVRAGVTERALSQKLKDILFEFGAEALAFEPIVASGKNAALPHAAPSLRKLRTGDIVLLDFGARVGGYVSDMSRTVAIGKVSARLRRVHGAVRRAEEIVCAAARPGVAAAELDLLCRRELASANLEKYFLHATGHGIGMEIHEEPVIAARSKDILCDGDVITCEPGVYLPDEGGVRIEDSLAIVKGETVNLTAGATKELLIL